MLILNDPALINRIPDLAIRNLVHRRFSEICDGEPYDYDLHGYMMKYAWIELHKGYWPVTL